MHVGVGGEVHVGNPHGYLAVGGPPIFDAPGAGAVDDGVEIERSVLCLLGAGSQRCAECAGRQQG